MVGNIQPIDTRAIFAQSLLSPRQTQPGINEGFNSLNKVIGAYLLKKAADKRQGQITDQNNAVAKAMGFVESGDTDALAAMSGELPDTMRAAVFSHLAKPKVTTRTEAAPAGSGFRDGTMLQIEETGGVVTGTTVIQAGEIPDDTFSALSGADFQTRFGKKIPEGFSAQINDETKKVSLIGSAPRSPDEKFSPVTNAEFLQKFGQAIPKGGAAQKSDTTGKYYLLGANGSTTEVNITDTSEGAFDKEFGKVRAEAISGDMDDIAAKAGEAFSNQQNVNAFVAALEGFETGSMSGLRSFGARFMTFLGGDPKDWKFLRAESKSSFELLQQLHERLALDVASSNAFKGNLNAQEIKIIEGSIVGLSKTVEGNRLIAEAATLGNQHSIARAKEMDDFLGDGIVERTKNAPQLGAHMRQWEADNPALNQEFIDKIRAGGVVPDASPGLSGETPDGRKYTSEGSVFQGWDDESGMAIRVSKEGVQFRDPNVIKPGFE
jgi:hypothetical protein